MMAEAGGLDPADETFRDSPSAHQKFQEWKKYHQVSVYQEADQGYLSSTDVQKNPLDSDRPSHGRMIQPLTEFSVDLVFQVATRVG